MADREIQIPPGGLQFSAPVQFAAPAQGGGARRFTGVAYGGGVITDHPYWDAVAFDLATLKAAAPMPLLLQHDPDRVIGVIDTVTNSGGDLQVAGKLFTDTEPAAASVAAKADAGMPWQMSVRLWPDVVDEVQAGAAINGRPVDRATKVMRGARVRETSFVALGADSTTRATVFQQAEGSLRIRFTASQGEPPMADTTKNDDHAAALAAATAERDAFKAELEQTKTELTALKAQFAAAAKAKREAAVKELLGEQFTAELAAPYMDMTDAQFAAVQALKPQRTAGLPATFTTASGNTAPAGGKTITPDAIRQYMRDNPGATYETTFAALTAA